MKLSQELLSAVSGYIDAHRQDMLAMWQDFVNTRSDATNKERADEMARKLGRVLEGIGCQVSYTDVGEKKRSGR